MDLRCTCSTRPLLGRAIILDERWMLHVKVFKRGVVYGEMIVESGVVRIRCRACSRWYTVRIKREKPPVLDSSSEYPQE